MIDHISLRVQDLSRAVDFYKAALAPLGYEVLMEFPSGNVVGLGAGGKPDLWIQQTEQTPHPTHIALSGERPQIDEFHSVAQQVGGSDNGPPGVRLDYHPHYYAAFVLDPEGNNIEVVCHTPEGTAPMPLAKAARKAAPRKVAKKAMAAKAPSRGAKKAAKAAKPPKKAMKAKMKAKTAKKASAKKPAKGKKRR